MQRSARQLLNQHARLSVLVYRQLRHENRGTPPTLVDMVLRVTSVLAGLMPVPTEVPAEAPAPSPYAGHVLTCPEANPDLWGPL